MKKSIFVAIAFMAVTSTTSQLFAQEAAAVKPGYNVKANVKCRVIATETGCTIVFDNGVQSPRDVATGQASGKRGYDYYKAISEFSVSASDNSVSEVKSPRDAASGQATGKRQHSPITITKEMDKSSPKLAEAVMGSGGGAGKVNVQDISFMIRCGGKSTKLSVVDGECVIPTDTCPNGSCSLIASWSWGMSNSGGSSMGSGGSGRCSVDFLLEIEDGACTSMAINEKGLPGGKSSGTTKK
ncbi:MAG: type VI secretion system tube protein Hcp [Flavobacterium sp.]|nr:type VI secretion system tube protein Hcp [Flavobacterium sp.]